MTTVIGKQYEEKQARRRTLIIESPQVIQAQHRENGFTVNMTGNAGQPVEMIFKNQNAARDFISDMTVCIECAKDGGESE